MRNLNRAILLVAFVWAIFVRADVYPGYFPTTVFHLLPVTETDITVANEEISVFPVIGDRDLFLRVDRRHETDPEVATISGLYRVFRILRSKIPGHGEDFLVFEAMYKNGNHPFYGNSDDRSNDVPSPYVRLGIPPEGEGASVLEFLPTLDRVVEAKFDRLLENPRFLVGSPDLAGLPDLPLVGPVLKKWAELGPYEIQEQEPLQTYRGSERTTRFAAFDPWAIRSLKWYTWVHPDESTRAEITFSDQNGPFVVILSATPEIARRFAVPSETLDGIINIELLVHSIETLGGFRNKHLLTGSAPNGKRFTMSVPWSLAHPHLRLSIEEDDDFELVLKRAPNTQDTQDCRSVMGD